MIYNNFVIFFYVTSESG